MFGACACGVPVCKPCVGKEDWPFSLSALSVAAWAQLFGLVTGAGAGKAALLAIVAIAVGQSWVALLARRRASRSATVMRACAALAFSATAPALACALYAGATWWLGTPLALGSGPNCHMRVRRWCGPRAVQAHFKAPRVGGQIRHLHGGQPGEA